MLTEKRKCFKELLNILKDEWLTGKGWIASFCQTYHIQEIRQHREAASINTEAVEVEHKQLQAELAEYELRDIFNVDETGMLAFATPDQGLATRKMSGRKQDKF